MSGDTACGRYESNLAEPAVFDPNVLEPASIALLTIPLPATQTVRERLRSRNRSASSIRQPGHGVVLAGKVGECDTM